MSFSETYAEARAAFRAEALEAGGELRALHVCDDPAHGPLSIDVAVFDRGSRGALAISSGVHGIEGFAGSAIQRDFIGSGLPGDLTVLLVHCVNPYGMACVRRVNENNVDLNRNVILDGSGYSGASDGYRELYTILNPETPHGGRDAFLPRALLKIARHGMPALRQAVAGGQFDFPRGLFWGGSELERGPACLLESLPGLVPDVEHLVFIDVHTGLGRSGTFAILVNALAGSAEHRRLVRHYGERVQPLDARQSVAYQIRGALVEGVTQPFGAPVEVLTQEFGTYGPIAVIRALRAENRAHHWGGDVEDAKRMLREAFYPRSGRWRRAVLAGGRDLIGRAVARLRDASGSPR